MNVINRSLLFDISGKIIDVIGYIGQFGQQFLKTSLGCQTNVAVLT